MNSKRIAGVQPVAHDGPYHESAIQFMDGTTIGMAGVIANHANASACGTQGLPTDAVNYNVLRSQTQEAFVKKAGHYAERAAEVYARVEGTNPGAWRIFSTRPRGLHGTAISNRRLLHESWAAEAHVFLPQAPANYTSASILDQVDTLRDYQKAQAPTHEVDILPHVPVAGAKDVAVIVDVAADEPALFLDLRGANPKIIAALGEARAQLGLMADARWLGATQAAYFCGPAAKPAMMSAQLNALGIMASSAALGGTFAGDDSNLVLANKKVWPQRGRSLGVARHALTPSVTLAPQAPGLDLANDTAIAGHPAFFDVYRNDVLVAGAHEAARLRQHIVTGNVGAFLTARPEIRP